MSETTLNPDTTLESVASTAFPLAQPKKGEESGDDRGHKRDLLGLQHADLLMICDELALKSFRAKQIHRWIYNQGLRDFQAMTDLAKHVRAIFEEHFFIARPTISSEQKSNDGTIKWLLRFDDGNEAEMVYIPEPDRGTLCISSQVGCTLTCRFCHTGTQRLVRNLTVSEMVGQAMLARDCLDDWGTTSESRKVTNIVMMGMGEPLYNTENVIKALKIFTDGDGFSLSKRRVTLSTSGVVPELHKVGHAVGARLAISLHATNDSLRNDLVPINKKYPIEQLIEAVRSYPNLNNAHRVTWEYVMLKGVNDSIEDAQELVKLIKNIPSKINLIPFNPWPGAPYQCSDAKQIEVFAQVIMKAGYPSPVRRPRGRDIHAACGQLKSASIRVRKNIRVKETQQSEENKVNQC